MMTMARIATVDLEAKNRLAGRATGYSARAPYREAIAHLTGDRALELQPDEGETLRKLKLLVRRAAKEVSRDVQYGESDEGTLVVWLAAPTTGAGKRRGRSPGSGRKAQATLAEPDEV
jgi:hypothetical protein